ncbi:MAG: DUF4838 domain-containing protein, partial [Planctomycetes bacterium]|nr:DUF4838 domain-containing protein [Planctomycetota bacterium]
PVKRRITITGNTGLAVLYGVYQYLSDLGVRWLAPGDIGTNIPRFADVHIRAGKRSYSPSFDYRCLSLSSTPENHFGGTDIQTAYYDYQLYLLRNRTQFEHNRMRYATRGAFAFNLVHGNGGHGIKARTGLDKADITKQPERFALVTESGVQKRRFDGGQVCFTNRENIQRAIESCVAFFREMERTKGSRCSDLDDLYIVEVSQSDCSGYCECENCAKVAGKGPGGKDRLAWHFWNLVAKALDEKMPGKLIGVISPYMDLTQPPDDVKIEPNIMVITPLVFSWEKAPENKESYPFPKSFAQCVSRIKGAGATVLQSYSYLNFPWSPTPLHILDAAQGFAKLGYRRYHLEAMQRSEYAWPIVWSLAQFTWDSTKDPREYLKEFCREYYGAPYDQDVLWILEDMTRRAYVMERMNYGSCLDTSSMFPDELIKKARDRLVGAVRQSQGRPQARLRRFRDAMEAQFRLAETYRAYCKALNNRTAEDIADFEKRASGLETFWQQNDLKSISTTARTPQVAAQNMLKTDFAHLKPSARKEIDGKGPGDERWMQELFAGSEPPRSLPNLFPLPEIWKFHIDYDNRGIEDGYFRVEHDDSKGWPAVSTWNFPSAQGYDVQIGGYFWYRVKFRAPLFPAGKKVFLRIGALDDSGDVYLNGIKVGSQPPGDWDKSFAMDVTKQIRPGAENVLAVHGYDSGGREGVWRPSALYTD